jgi:hypothetical protein
MGIWQKVAMYSLKYHSGLPCPNLLHPVSGPLLKPLQGGRPVAIFYLFGHPMLCAYASPQQSWGSISQEAEATTQK